MALEEIGARAMPALDALEARVLGVLIEKELTTPDQYPLSMNALLAGCNQKSNRFPEMLVSEAEASSAAICARARAAWRRSTHRRISRRRSSRWRGKSS